MDSKGYKTELAHSRRSVRVNRKLDGCQHHRNLNEKYNGVKDGSIFLQVRGIVILSCRIYNETTLLADHGGVHHGHDHFVRIQRRPGLTPPRAPHLCVWRVFVVVGIRSRRTIVCEEYSYVIAFAKFHTIRPINFWDLILRHVRPLLRYVICLCLKCLLLSFVIHGCEVRAGKPYIVFTIAYPSLILGVKFPVAFPEHCLGRGVVTIR